MTSCTSVRLEVYLRCNQKELSFARTPLLAQFSFSFCPDFRRTTETGTTCRTPSASRVHTGNTAERFRCGCRCGIMHVQNGKQKCCRPDNGWQHCILSGIVRGYRLSIRRGRPSRQPCHPRQPDSSTRHRTLSPTHRHTFSECQRTLSG